MSTALILVDLQNAFCHPNGSFQNRFGAPIHLTRTLKACQHLHAAAGRRKVLTIFTQLQFDPHYKSAGLLVTHLAPAISTQNAYLQNSWDSAISDVLHPSPTDIIFPKTRYDPFIKTPLAQLLRRRKITHLVIAGVLTNVCVEATARSAFDHDFLVTLVPQATTALSAKLKAASLQTLKTHYARLLPLTSPALWLPPAIHNTR